MNVTKVFKHGGSQAIRMPKKFRFETSEVYISKTPDGILLKPKSGRETLKRKFVSLAGSCPDFPLPNSKLPLEKRDFPW